MRLLRIVWLNKLSEESKAHLAINLTSAVCGQFLGDGFHIVPLWYGETCTMCGAMLINPHISPAGALVVEGIKAVHPSELEK